LFPGKDYIGVDVRPGAGVDLVADVEALPQPDASVGTVIAMSTLEHVPHFWRGIDEMTRVLRSDGGLLLSVPFYFHIHNHPSDYWRFTPEALDLLVAEYPTRIIGWHGPPKRPSNVWVVAFGEEWPAISADQVSHYQALLARYAHQPQHWFKRL